MDVDLDHGRLNEYAEFESHTYRFDFRDFVGVTARVLAARD